MKKSIVLFLALTGCSTVTPQDRAAGYEREAQAFQVLCKAYHFDRENRLVADVPAMTELCR